MSLTTVISSDTSSLNIGDFKDTILLDECVSDIKQSLIHRPEIRVFGKTCHQPRDVGFFSDESVGYKYSRQMMRSQPLTDSLTKLLDTINHMFSSDFNGILVNLYRDGNDSIGDHSDDENILSSQGVVAVSTGATRKFRIRDKQTRKIVKDIEMHHGMIVQMSGEFQKHYTHGIPVEKRVKEPRISFTFRHHTE